MAAMIICSPPLQHSLVSGQTYLSDCWTASHPHLSNVGFGRDPTIFVTFWNRQSDHHSHLIHIGQVCGGEKVRRVWTLSLSLFTQLLLSLFLFTTMNALRRDCPKVSPFVRSITPCLSLWWVEHHLTSLPIVGEAVPQALAVTPEQPVEDPVKEPVKVETLYVRFPPDPLQCWAYIGMYNVQHLSDGESERVI